MRPILALAAALMIGFSISPVGAQEPPASAYNNVMEQRLTVEQVRRDVAIAESAYSSIHPGYTRYADALELRKGWAAIVSEAEKQGGMTLPEFYLATQLVLTRIRCDHTKAELPATLKQARAGQPLYLPFRWTLVEGRGIVDSSSDGTGLRRGDEILAIDGRPLETVISDVAAYVPVDGYTDWSRNGGITQSGEFMGGAVDHFGMLLWETGPQALLSVKSADGATRDVSVGRISFEDWSALATTGSSEFKDAITFERIGEKAAYLSVDTFVNYRAPVSPQDLYGPVFEALRNEGRDTLILDLRRNGGGSTDASQGLIANLIATQRPIKREMRIATLDHAPWEGMLRTWDQRAINPDPRGFIKNEDGSYTLRDGIMDETAPVSPTDVAFNGRLLILTSADNSSGSTNLIAHLASRSNTVTIGERTGGSAEGPTAGVVFFLTLPESGVVARIPMFRQWNNVDSFEEGMGVTPDEVVPMTVAAYRMGADPALDRAKQVAATPYNRKVAAAEINTATIADFAALEGENWKGQLDYLNYGSDDRSTIPVRMVAEAPQGRMMPYGFLYPGEEEKNANDAVRISRDGSRLNGMAIIERKYDATGALVLVALTEGRDDNRPADIRLTYSIAPNSFTVRKDVRFADGEYFNRNEYRLTR